MISNIEYKQLGSVMERAFQFVSILMIVWFSIIFFSGPLGEPTPGVDCNRTKLDQQANVAPINPESGIAGIKPLVEPAGPGSELSGPREVAPETGKRIGSFFRAPIQIAKLIKCKNLEAVVKKYAQQHGIDEDLIWAVIRQESGFNPGAVSPKGAMGLMQLMPGTAALMGVSDPFDVEQNIAGGVKYLEQCLNKFNQDVPLALAAYNAGPGNVVKYQGCPPFAETRNYVASILQAYAGETIQNDWKLCRVNYVMEEEASVPVRVMGLPWRIPLPNWKITTPQCKLSSPNWKTPLRPF